METDETRHTLHLTDVEIEIDHQRGVIYVHAGPTSMRELQTPTILRIQGLPTPIPSLRGRMLDINVKNAWCDWSGDGEVHECVCGFETRDQDEYAAHRRLMKH